VSTANLHDEDTERALLGACLLDAALVSGLLHVQPDDFADPRRAAIWAGMREYAGGEFSASSLKARLGARCTREVREEISDLEGGAFTSSGTRDLAERLQGLATKRRIAKAARRMLEGALSAIVTADELSAIAYRETLEATARTGRSQPLTHAELVDAGLAEIQRNRAAAGGLTGLTTGLPSLDALTSGMHQGELWLLAARPGCGKTALALSMAHAAALAGTPVAFASLEMPRSQLGMRAVAWGAQVPLGAIRRGTVDEAMAKSIERGVERLWQLPILSWDDYGVGLADLRSLALRTRAQFGSCGLVIVDYLQLMAVEDRRVPREQQVATIARGLKSLSKELCCPVLALSQLSRDGEKKGRKPVLSDLRESGSLEQDADTVLMLHRADDRDDGAATPVWTDVECIVAKQRNGPTNAIDLRFRGSTMQFEERA